MTVMKMCPFRIPSTGISTVNWTPVSKNPNTSVVSLLKINSAVDVHVDEDKQLGRISFWDSLGFNENENYSLN